MRWNVSTVYLGSNDFNSPQRPNLTHVSSSWEVHTDNRTPGQICVLILSPCQQGWTHPRTRIYWRTTCTENNVCNTIPALQPYVRQAATPDAVQQR